MNRYVAVQRHDGHKPLGLWLVFDTGVFREITLHITRREAKLIACVLNVKTTTHENESKQSLGIHTNHRPGGSFVHLYRRVGLGCAHILGLAKGQSRGSTAHGSPAESANYH